MNLHYGCGTTVGAGWLNCDASPTLRLQRLPIAGAFFRKMLQPCFPEEVQYGDIVQGLKISPNSCDAIFCSHVLEHLALEDFRAALRNTYVYLKPTGVFRAVLPNLEENIREYIANPEPTAALDFMTYTNLGQQSRPQSLRARLREVLGNSRHLWMWDYKSMRVELENVGFRDMKPIQFGDSPNRAFAEVENEERFMWNPVAFECTK